MPNGQSRKHTYGQHFTDLRGYNRNIYVYTYTYTHIITISEQRDHEFEAELGEIYGKAWMEERKRSNAVIKL